MPFLCFGRCGVGANKGTGLGFNEVYVTQTEDSELGPKGSLVKTLLDHGLNKYPTMRNRFMETLKAADGSSMVFLATKGVKRADGEKNQHRMFRLKEGLVRTAFTSAPSPDLGLRTPKRAAFRSWM